ncbi:hypothetical protein SLA2020_494900 [Shorea laevis]
MLKAIQILGCCSSGFVWKPRSSARSESNPDGRSASSSSVAVQPSAGNVRKINFCQWCGGPTKHEIPDGEEKMRAICTVCGKIAYQNPKMVVGCLVEHDNKVLLCKRKIQPSYGLWTLPAGYMEIGESAAEGAIREPGKKQMQKWKCCLLLLNWIFLLLAKLI